MQRAVRLEEFEGRHRESDAFGDLTDVELVLADVATLEAQLDKRRKAAKADKSLGTEVAALEKAMVELEAGTPVYRSALAATEPTASFERGPQTPTSVRLFQSFWLLPCPTTRTYRPGTVGKS